MEIWRRHTVHWSDRKLATKTLVGLAILSFCAFVVQPYAVNFSTEAAGSGVGDIVLSNTPVLDVGIFFVYGMFALIGVITLLCILHPARAAFTINAISLFIVTRSIFVSLTHLGPFATQATSDFGPAITKAFFGADFFFSGHTGAPFLMALMYWHIPFLRYLFLAWSVFFGIIVLLGHLHYSIDVLSAFFITYAIFHLASWLMPAQRALFLGSK